MSPDFPKTILCPRISPNFGALANTHETLGREINPVVMSREEFGQKYAEKDRFVCRVMNEPKIFVRGGANDLGKLIGCRAS